MVSKWRCFSLLLLADMLWVVAGCGSPDPNDIPAEQNAIKRETNQTKVRASVASPDKAQTIPKIAKVQEEPQPRVVTVDVPPDPHVDHSAPKTEDNPLQQEMEQYAPHASGLCLAEIVEITQKDDRPGDGPLWYHVKLKILRSSGKTLDMIRILAAYSGFLTGITEANPYPLKPNSLHVGDRCWFAFCPTWNFERKYPQGIINCWLDQRANGERLKTPKPFSQNVEGIVPRELFEKAIEEDCYQWHPEYWPHSGLTKCYNLDEENQRWFFRTMRGNRILWQKVIPGQRERGRFFHLPPSPILADPIETWCYETVVNLPLLNEYGVDAGKYYLWVRCDRETGQRHAVAIRSYENIGNEAVLIRYYSTETGLLGQEDRFDLILAGGLALGAPTERWRRKVSSLFDIYNGKLLENHVYRLSTIQDPKGSTWIDVTQFVKPLE